MIRGELACRADLAWQLGGSRAHVTQGPASPSHSPQRPKGGPVVHRSLHTDFEESMRLVGVAQEIARRTDDHREGVRAFVEKRKPTFKGR